MTAILAANFPTNVWDGLTDLKPKAQVVVHPESDDYNRLITEILAIQDYLITGDLTLNPSGTVIVSKDLEINAALNHDGTTVGFYGTTPVTQQTGVAVTAGGIHAALVNLGLIIA